MLSVDRFFRHVHAASHSRVVVMIICPSDQYFGYSDSDRMLPGSSYQFICSVLIEVLDRILLVTFFIPRKTCPYLCQFRKYS